MLAGSALSSEVIRVGQNLSLAVDDVDAHSSLRGLTSFDQAAKEVVEGTRFVTRLNRRVEANSHVKLVSVSDLLDIIRDGSPLVFGGTSEHVSNSWFGGVFEDRSERLGIATDFEGNRCDLLVGTNGMLGICLDVTVNLLAIDVIEVLVKEAVRILAVQVIGVVRVIAVGIHTLGV